MPGRPMTRLTEELAKIDASLRRRPATEIGPVERRIGRWMGKCPASARWVRAEIVRDGTGRAIELELSCPVKEGEHPTLAKGAYLLRTNCTETDPVKLWRWSMQLTQAEAAFRTAKGDMGLRPVFQPKTDRVEAAGKIRSTDVSVPVKRGEREVTLRLRTVAMPDADVAMLLARLGPRLPQGPRLVENVVEKTGC